MNDNAGTTTEPSKVEPQSGNQSPDSTHSLITQEIKNLSESIVNVFETGSKRGDYSNISIYHDGPNNVIQLTYGRSQTTEYGHLPELLNNYVRQYDPNNEPAYVSIIRHQSIYLGSPKAQPYDKLKAALKLAGNDPIMQTCQDNLFELRYWQPAYEWFESHGFLLPLSMAVIYDSFIHSGGILQFLRDRFEAMTPIDGGDEKAWIKEYLATRAEWLQDNVRTILRDTIYRPNFFLSQIQRDNWNLDKFSISVQGLTYNSVSDI